jgi:membrane protease YdiL (CAAX protease family)
MAVDVLHSPDGRLRPIWRFLIAVALFFLIQLAVSSLLRPESLITGHTVFAFATILTANIAIFAALSRVLDRATRPLASIGFSSDVPVLRLIVVGFIFGAALVSLAVLVIELGGSTTFRWRMDSVMMQAAATQLALFPLAALHEEVAFRGYPFQRLIDSLGAVPAVVVLSVLFAVPHLGNPNSTIFAAFNTAAVGALLAAAYLATRSLWLPWGIHWGWNLVLGVAYGLSVSGFDTDGPVDGSVAGPAWLTGGAYGIEGGASGSIAIVVGFAGLFWLIRQPALVGRPAPPPSAYVAAPPVSITAEGGPPSSSSS